MTAGLRLVRSSSRITVFLISMPPPRAIGLEHPYVIRRFTLGVSHASHKGAALADRPGEGVDGVAGRPVDPYGMTDHATALTQARRLLADRHPHALGALLGGSAARGQARPTSDLDLAVLLPDSDVSRREVIRHEGRPAEVFLHTLGDVPGVFERDRSLRRGTILFLYDQGVPLLDPHGHVARLRTRARELLATGPLPLTPPERERSRYVLTCWLDDLLDTPRTERYEQQREQESLEFGVTRRQPLRRRPPSNMAALPRSRGDAPSLMGATHCSPSSAGLLTTRTVITVPYHA